MSPKMAEDIPSLQGAFDILHQAGEDKLLYLKHKLKALRPGSRASHLLHTMVLLLLGQKTEARISLDSLRGDKVALFVAKTWEGTEPPLNQTDHLPPEEQADIQLAVARIYQLLVDEELCESSSRNRAYQIAIQSLSRCQDPRLDNILAEAQYQCGHDIHGFGNFQVPRSDAQSLPVSSGSASRVSSPSWPIRTRSCELETEAIPQSLHSTGTPASFVSNLEISQSSTLPFLTSQLQKSSLRGPSKLCGDTQDTSTQDSEPEARQEPEEMSWPSSEPAASLPEQFEVNSLTSTDLQAPSPSIPVSLTTPVATKTSIHSSVQCSEAFSDPKSLQPASIPLEETSFSKKDFESPPVSSPTAVPPEGEGKGTPLSVQESTFPKETSGPSPPVSSQDSSPSPLCSSLPSASELDTEQRFFNFVVLHAQEDVSIALRVRDTLESMGVPNGTTFCEEFQVPGHFELRCLQDAIDNSAFTILLLTKNFNCRMSFQQVHMAMMNSITRKDKHNTVIPFLPKESPLKASEVSQLLTGVVSLDETSPVFSRKVSSTFDPRKLKIQRERWRKEQEKQAIQKKTQQMIADRENLSQRHRDLRDYAYQYNLMQQQLQNLNMAFPNQASFAQGYNMPSLSPWPHGFPSQFYPAPSTFQPNQFIPSTPFHLAPGSVPQPDPQSSGGAQPLIIHNAQMVQFGLNNYMWGRNKEQDPSEEERVEGE